jgi:hypothetical protein
MVSGQHHPDQGHRQDRAETVLRLNKAKLAEVGREGHQPEQESKSMLVPVEDIELIGVELQEPVGAVPAASIEQLSGITAAAERPGPAGREAAPGRR